MANNTNINPLSTKIPKIGCMCLCQAQKHIKNLYEKYGTIASSINSLIGESDTTPNIIDNLSETIEKARKVDDKVDKVTTIENNTNTINTNEGQYNGIKIQSAYTTNSNQIKNTKLTLVAGRAKLQADNEIVITKSESEYSPKFQIDDGSHAITMVGGDNTTANGNGHITINKNGVINIRSTNKKSITVGDTTDYSTATNSVNLNGYSVNINGYSTINLQNKNNNKISIDSSNINLSSNKINLGNNSIILIDSQKIEFKPECSSINKILKGLILYVDTDISNHFSSITIRFPFSITDSSNNRYMSNFGIIIDGVRFIDSTGKLYKFEYASPYNDQCNLYIKDNSTGSTISHLDVSGYSIMSFSTDDGGFSWTTSGYWAN